MDKRQAIELVEKTFNNKFNETGFTKFIKEFLNEVDETHSRNWTSYIYDNFKKHISQYKRIGLYTDPNGNELELLLVKVKSVNIMNKARTSLRNFIIKWLQSEDNKSKSRDYALVAFYSNEDEGSDWRFSFIKLEHQAYKDKKADKVKVRKEFTPAKRYSFLVGENEHTFTAKKQLLPLLENIVSDPTIEDIENAFSIEKVTNEFFEQYKNIFIKFNEHLKSNNKLQLELNSTKIDTARFTKKLLGQIVFLYFLQKKGWLGVEKNRNWGNGDKRFIQNLFDISKKANKNYFKDYLQYLFYEALAIEHSDESIASYYSRFNSKIPFLNGGLFEADYNWETAKITIPNELFRTYEENEDKRTGLLDIFDRYNFTIKEDEPLEKEIAIDPEMLGKVFENMLDITERKSKGAFYTPREIVHYMCQESLINYIDNSLNNEIPKKDIEEFIHNGHFALENDERVTSIGKETGTYKYNLPETIRNSADNIDKALVNIKILDPAIGSGAFPVGMLNELVNAHLVLKTHLSSNYFILKTKTLGLNPNNANENRYNYHLKREIIEKNIYGVDIDASAIDIARLRLWLSLVVEQEESSEIETLPNLNYKIVCGNSLVSRYNLDTPIGDVFKGLNSSRKKSKIVKKILNGRKFNLAIYKELSKEFVNESSAERKKDLKFLIEEIKNSFKKVFSNRKNKDIIEKQKEIIKLESPSLFGGKVGSKEEIDDSKKELIKLENEKKSHENDEIYHNAVEWRFEFPNLLDENGNFIGFDVVIGNPPYNELRDLTQNEIYSYKNSKYYEYAKGGRVNLFQFFYPLGINVVSNNRIITLITQNSILAEESANNNRNYILKKCHIIKVDSFPERDDINKRVFKSAKMSVAILHLLKTSKQNDTNNFKITVHKDKFMLNYHELVINKNIIKSIYPQNKIFPIANQNSFNILLHINSILNKFILHSTSGEIDMTKYKNNFISKGEYRVITGAQVLKYFLTDKPSQGSVLFLNSSDLLISKKRIKDLQKKRIAMQRITGVDSKIRIISTLIDENILCANSTNYISENETQYNLKYILAIINSSLINFYFKQTSTNTNVTTTEINKIPIIIPKDNNTQILSIIVDYIIFLKKQSIDFESRYFEAIIDGMVYELYFPDEITRVNKNIIKHLNDLKPINDDMADEEKLSIIKNEFERLYDLHHPVRNNIETLDSIEEIKIIKESLK